MWCCRKRASPPPPPLRRPRLILSEFFRQAGLLCFQASRALVGNLREQRKSHKRKRPAVEATERCVCPGTALLFCSRRLPPQPPMRPQPHSWRAWRLASWLGGGDDGDGRGEVSPQVAPVTPERRWHSVAHLPLVALTLTWPRRVWVCPCPAAALSCSRPSSACTEGRVWAGTGASCFAVSRNVCVCVGGGGCVAGFAPDWVLGAGGRGGRKGRGGGGERRGLAFDRYGWACVARPVRVAQSNSSATISVTCWWTSTRTYPVQTSIGCWVRTGSWLGRTYGRCGHHPPLRWPVATQPHPPPAAVVVVVRPVVLPLLPLPHPHPFPCSRCGAGLPAAAAAAAAGVRR